MPDAYKLYLDQMLRLEVAQALKDEGHDVLRASEVGQARRMTIKYCRKRSMKTEFLLLLMNILEIG